MLKKSDADSPNLVPNNQWERILVSPEIIETKQDGKDHRKRASDFLDKRLNKSNQLFVAKLVGASVSSENTSPISAVLRSTLAGDLTKLCTFARLKGVLSAAEDQYEVEFTTGEKRSHRADLVAVGTSKSVTLHAFAKLILLVMKDAKQLERIYLRMKWQSRATREAFVASRPLDHQVRDGLVSSADEVADSFVTKKDASSRLFLHGETDRGLHVFLFQRELAPSQQVDYRNGIHVYHGFGWVLFAIDSNKNRIAFKGGGEECAKTVVRWIEENSKGLTLTPEGIAPHGEFDFDAVAKNILGGYARDSELDLVELSLTRCNRRSLSPISIGPPEYGRSIRDDLSYMAENDGIALVSLFDLSKIKVRFGDDVISIAAEPSPGGTILLRASDANVNPLAMSNFVDAFEKTFGLPLNVRIDPRVSSSGHAPAIAALLDSTAQSKVPNHLNDELKKLCSQGILEKYEVVESVCGQTGCDVNVVTSGDSDCPKCHVPLNPVKRPLIRRNPDGIYKYLQSTIKPNTGWKLLKGLESEQKHGEVYQLVPKQIADKPFAVLVAEQSDPHLIKRCGKFHRPVVVVHTHGLSNGPFTDELGMVHFHLADLLAAEKCAHASAAFFFQLNELLHASQSRTEEILLRAAAIGCDRVAKLPDEYHDQEFERDVFSILRRMFPFTEKWGGGNKADGFVSIPYIVGASIRDIAKLNFSYDAKLTCKVNNGYDLNKSEKRKAFDYVLALQRQPVLQANGNKLNAHVFISNFISEDAIRGVASHFAEPHSDAALLEPVPVLVLRTDFLLAIYDGYSKSVNELANRQLFIGRNLANLFNQTVRNGVAILNKQDGEKFVKDLLEMDPYANPVDGRKLAKWLKK